MAPKRCARCGRRLPEENSSPAATPADPATPAGLHRPWASIEGADVCPDCQTPLERREVGMRVVAAIEAEIERRRRNGVPPDSVEGALLAYAMSVREEMGAASDAAGVMPIQPGNRSENVSEPLPSRQLKVAMTAAFLTGHPLAVRIASYRVLQSDLDAALRGPGWRVHRLQPRGGTYYEYGGGFAEALPLVIARREGPEMLSHLRYELEKRRRIAGATPGYHLEPTDLTIDVYDLGVAVLTAWFDVSAPADARLPIVARTLKHLAVLESDDGSSPVAQALQEVAHDTAQKYGAAVRTAVPEHIQSSWLSGRATSLSSNAPIDDHGRLLWLHPVHVLEEGSPSRESAEQLAPVFHQTIRVGNAVFAPGVGASAIVTLPDSTGADTPVRLTQLHWAYYALYMAIDRGLLAILNQGSWSESASLSRLERDADDVFGDYLRVMEARARLDSELTALGGDEFAIWRVIADVQRFDAVVDAVERKIEVVQRLTERRVDQAAADRATRTAKILGGLTVLTVLTVAIAVIGYFFGTIKADGLRETWLRIAVVAGACAFAFCIWWLSFSERASARRARRRNPR